MAEEDFWQEKSSGKKFFSSWRKYFWEWLFSFIGFSLICIGLAQNFGWLKQEKTVSLKTTQAADSAATLWVDISGAVTRPGLYQLSNDSRVGDLLDRCGGLDNLASQEFISKELNRARILSDGEKIYIPFFDFQPEDTSVTVVNNDKVNLNKATPAQLEALPGIGATYAQRIVDYRQQNGHFETKEELLLVKGIGEATLAKISDSLVVR